MSLVMKYCYVIETLVEIKDNECKKQCGSPTMRFTCPNRYSIICPEKELIRVNGI